MSNETFNPTGNFNVDQNTFIAHELQRKEIENKVREQTGLNPVPNREFSIPEITLTRLDSPNKTQVEAAVQGLVDWLHTQAIKDRFGTSPEGAQERIDWANHNRQQNGEVANEAWLKLGRNNKFRVNSQIMPVLTMKMIVQTYLKDDPNISDLESAYTKAVEHFEQVTEDYYRTMDYDQRLEFIHTIEDDVVFFLTQLHALYQ